MSRTVSGLPIYCDMGYSKPVLSRLAPVRELRDLMRYRKTMVRERADEVNRLQKVLETANVKLASVGTDVMGKSGRSMLAAILGGQVDPELLAELARGRLRAKWPDWRQ